MRTSDATAAAIVRYSFSVARIARKHNDQMRSGMTDENIPVDNGRSEESGNAIRIAATPSMGQCVSLDARIPRDKPDGSEAVAFLAPTLRVTITPESPSADSMLFPTNDRQGLGNIQRSRPKTYPRQA